MILNKQMLLSTVSNTSVTTENMNYTVMNITTINALGLVSTLVSLSTLNIILLSNLKIRFQFILFYLSLHM